MEECSLGVCVAILVSPFPGVFLLSLTSKLCFVIGADVFIVPMDLEEERDKLSENAS